MFSINSKLVSQYLHLNPLQILFDFELRCRNVDTEAFVKIWPEFSTKWKNILRQNKQADQYATMWSDDIDQFLIMMRLLPPGARGRNQVAQRQNFHSAIDKMIVFNKVSVLFI